MGSSAFSVLISYLLFDSFRLFGEGSSVIVVIGVVVAAVIVIVVVEAEDDDDEDKDEDDDDEDVDVLIMSEDVFIVSLLLSAFCEVSPFACIRLETLSLSVAPSGVK